MLTSHVVELDYKLLKIEIMEFDLGQEIIAVVTAIVGFIVGLLSRKKSK